LVTADSYLIENERKKIREQRLLKRAQEHQGIPENIVLSD